MTFTFKHGDQPLAGYTIQRGVGRGGFGEVYYAVAESGKEVALKYLRDNPQTELRGVAHCLNLKSPHLVTIYDVKQNDDGDYFVVMEYVSGPSLRDLLVEAPEGLGVEKATFFTDGIAKGLRYLHERGIVHRDMKPGNIFYEEGYVKIGDYGLSKFISPSQHSGQTMSVGTVHYMAPEIGSGHYQAGTDIYALGVMLYELLLGRVPFQGATMGEILMKHLTQQPEVDELPEPFPGVIRKALAKDPRDRYQSVDEMTAALLGRAVTRDALSRFDVSSMTMHADRVAARAGIHAHVPVGAGPGGSSQLPPLPGAGEVPTVTYIPPGGRSSSVPRRIGRVVETVGRQIEQTVEEVGGRLTRRDRARLANTPMFPPRDRLTAGLLGIILGTFGAHRFYLGYTSIGIIQAVLSLLSVGAIGAIWGLIEGIVILGGGMTDVYGRPIVSRPAERRSGLIRGLWGVMSVVLLLGIVPLILVPVLVDVKGSGGFHPGLADILSTELKSSLSQLTASGELTPQTADTIVANLTAPLRANTYPLSFMWAIVGVPAALSAFCAWKASHRLGLSFWSATGRPLALALCGAAIVAAFMLALYFKPTSPVDGPMLFVVGLFTLLGAAVWQIRGDTTPVRPEDQDRESGLAWLCVVGTVVCGLAIAVVHQPPPAIRFMLSSWLDGTTFRFEPLLVHGVTMVAGALVVCLALESWHRMKRHRRARALAEPAIASPGSTDGCWTPAGPTSKAAKAEAKRIRMEAKAEAKRIKKAGKSSGGSCCR